MSRSSAWASPTIYQIETGDRYSQLVATPLWSDPGVMPAGYSNLVSYVLGDATYVLAAGGTQGAVYAVANGGQGLRQAATQTLEAAYSSLSVATFNNQQYLLGYDPGSGNFDFYQLQADGTFTSIYQFAGPASLTTTSLFTYRGALYFIGYNMATGAVAYYQVTPAGSGITAAQIWSDTWAQGWTRFTFFQMAMENFFFKTNTKYINCNIDHIMDDPSTGSHPVGTKLPLSQDLDVVQAFYLAGDAFFATYVAASGAVTLNRFLASGQGWLEGADFTAFANGSTVTPVYQGDNTFLLLY